MAGAAGSLLDTGGFLEEVAGRWCLRDEREGAVGLDLYESRYRDSGFDVRGARIEFLAKVHRLDAFGTQRRANWRGRCGLASTN